MVSLLFVDLAVEYSYDCPCVFCAAGFDRVPLRDFSGIEDCDQETKEAILSFSYELAKGMDQ